MCRLSSAHHGFSFNKTAGQRLVKYVKITILRGNMIEEFEPDDWWDDYDDTCYECQGYGDDYYVDENGELECHCFDCPFSGFNDDYWDD